MQQGLKVLFECEGGTAYLGLCVPSSASGVTYGGSGWDGKHREPGPTKTYLIACGVPPGTAAVIASLCGWSGDTAKAQIKALGLTDFKFTPAQIEKFFIDETDVQIKELKRICTKPDVIKAYGDCHWDTMNEKIKMTLLICLYRGDFVGASRKILMPAVVKNDLSAFTLAMNDKWFDRVPKDRMRRIREYLKSPTEKTITSFNT